MKKELWHRKVALKEYQHLLGLFKANPKLLVDCGLYHEGNDGVRFFWNNCGVVEERFATWEEMSPRTVKAYLEEVTGG